MTRSKFEGITNRRNFDTDQPHIQVLDQERLFFISIVRDPEILGHIKSLDDQVFGQHQGISLEELEAIAAHGHVLSLTSEDGNLIGESQILLDSIEQYPNLGETDAYCYGTAITPEYQGSRNAHILYKAQEVAAREAGKTRMIMTVRVENAASIRARLKAGFRVTAYQANVYGTTQEGGSRLVMQKDLINEPLPFDLPTQVQRILTTTPIATSETLQTLIDQKIDEIAVAIKPGDEVDLAAHELLKVILNQGYTGIGILKATEVDLKIEPDLCLMVLRRNEAGPLVEKTRFPLKVNSETGTLREVIVTFPPETAQVTAGAAINKVAAVNIGNVDPIAAKEEYQRFLDVLKNEGVSLVRSSFRGTNGRTAVFTRDPAFILNGTMVIGRMGREVRAGESDAMNRITDASETLPLYQDQDEAVLEGGDILFLTEKVIAVGLGQRTNAAGLKKLQDTFPDLTFVAVPHTELHLDVLFTKVAADKALADTTRLPESFLSYVETLGIDIIQAAVEEQDTLGCNVLAVAENRVIAVAQNHQTNQRLRERGVTVIEVSLPNLIKKGGGPRCMTCPTHRE